MKRKPMVRITHQYILCEEEFLKLKKACVEMKRIVNELQSEGIECGINGTCMDVIDTVIGFE